MLIVRLEFVVWIVPVVRAELVGVAEVLVELAMLVDSG